MNTVDRTAKIEVYATIDMYTVSQKKKHPDIFSCNSIKLN